MAAGANPKEVAARAGHTSVSLTLDRYGHLLAGSEQRLRSCTTPTTRRVRGKSDFVRARGAHAARTRRARGAHAARTRGTHAARTRDDRDESVSDAQASDQDEFGGRCGGRCGTRTHDLSRVKADCSRRVRWLSPAVMHCGMASLWHVVPLPCHFFQ